MKDFAITVVIALCCFAIGFMLGVKGYQSAVIGDCKTVGVIRDGDVAYDCHKREKP